MEEKNKSLRVRTKSYARKITATIVGAALFLSVIPTIPTANAGPARSVSSPFLYNFNADGVLPEAGSMNDSWSPYFWLNSGGLLPISGGVGGTVHGSLPTDSFWRILYGRNNPLDTGNGYYPQNLFRLVTRSEWKNVVSEVAFKIDKMNLTDTPNRDGYSGILMMNRYAENGQTLYYAGLRQDGAAVIKKKLNGTYYTIAYAKVFPGVYHKWNNPNLIPENQWMKLRTVTKDQADGSVLLEVWLDKDNNGQWSKILTGVDQPGKYGSSVIKGPAYAGIRTDFMDVSLDNYRLTEI